MIIVLDTNVWVSAMVFGGNPRSVLQQVSTQDILIGISEEILSEIRRILHSKFPTFVPKFENLFLSLQPKLSFATRGAIQIDICRDPKDNMVLETAVIAGAKFIISGDSDLLTLKRYKNITILSPIGFLKPE